MKNAYVLYHNSDIDGFASAALVKRYLLRREFNSATIRFIGINYSDFLHGLADVARKAKGGDEVYIVDMNVNEGWMVLSLFKGSVPACLSRIKERKCYVSWFDHHFWRKYFIDKVQPFTGNLHIDFKASSTCRLIKEALLADDNVAEKLCLIADQVDRDMWLEAEVEKKIDWDQPCWRWYLISEAVGKELVPAQWVVEKMVESGAEWSQALEDLALTAKREVDHGVEGALQKTVVRNIGGLKVAVTAANPQPCKASLLGLYVYLANNVDLSMMILPNGSVSIRSIKGLACDVALRFHGGGHPKAAGAMLPLKRRLLLMLLRVYPTEWIWRVIQSYVGGSTTP